MPRDTILVVIAERRISGNPVERISAPGCQEKQRELAIDKLGHGC